jgi:hypothetical protein
MPSRPAGQTTAQLPRFGLPAFAAVRPKVPAHEETLGEPANQTSKPPVAIRR